MDGFSLQKYMQENPVGLGTVEFTSKKDMKKTKLHRIESAFIPDYIKTITCITEEIKENGLKNFKKVTEDNLKEMLDDKL